MKVAACLLVRNEERSVREWLAYYHVIGVDACIVLDHGSVDGTAEAVRDAARFQNIHLVQLSLTRGLGAEPNFQTLAYDTACRMFAGMYDWIGCFDLDEFLFVPDGLRPWLQSFGPEVSQVSVNWAMFGSNGHVTKPSGLMIEDYTTRAGPDFNPALLCKSLVRPERLRSWANAHGAHADGESVGADGAPVKWNELVGRQTEPPRYDVAAVNHYFTRSRSHWEERLTRMSAFKPGQANNTRTMEMFDQYDRREIVDARAAVHANAVRRQMAATMPLELRRDLVMV